MSKVGLTICDTLTYFREVILEVPNHINEVNINDLLDNAENKASDGDEFLYNLSRMGCNIINHHFVSPYYPSKVETTCEDFNFITETKE